MPTNKDVEIRVKGISHRYNSQLAVNDVSFCLEGRKITGLLGANGAGKSTIMNIMCGCITPTAGDVCINGYSIRENPVEAKRQIGFLPQKPPLLMDLTVEEYLRHTARLRMVPGIRAAVEEALEKCAIAHFRKRLIKHLSGGYQQRVGIAQAIIHKPSFIVLDEPTNGLDPMQIIEIRKLIKEISSECLVMLSTHILHEVQLACEHILMMSTGELIFNGSINDFNMSVSPKSVIVNIAELDDLSTIAAVPGITAVEPVLDHPDTYRIDFDGAADDICERIVRSAADNGWHLREITKEMPSADDIFKYLTAKPHIKEE